MVGLQPNRAESGRYDPSEKTGRSRSQRHEAHGYRNVRRVLYPRTLCRLADRSPDGS